ncbi:MAG: penicillin-binding transpeptidase domain-containing protein, partial [Pseudomonadota bacterium]|nr:penicillin-binding transpeptidase domain-containing protein [Pseudomonadota bacterium]
GDLRRLHLATQRRDGYDAAWTALPQPAPTRITDRPEHLRPVQEGMVATIHGRGTATAMAREAEYRMAGKTGTAQKIGRKGGASMDPRTLPYHLRHQALFVGYAPAEDPTIAVAVVVEHGGYGGTTAAPIARKIFDAWLLGTMPEPPMQQGVDQEVPTALFANVVSQAAGLGTGNSGLASADPQSQTSDSADAKGAENALHAVLERAAEDGLQIRVRVPSSQSRVPAP